MDNTDYCSYELARKLKECGFNWPTHNGYSQKMRIEPVVSFGEPKKVYCMTPKNFNDNRKGISKGLEFYSAPALWEAQKWLRDEKNIIILIDYDDYAGWTFFSPHKDISNNNPYCESYELALESGISAALELIGKEAKGE